MAIGLALPLLSQQTTEKKSENTYNLPASKKAVFDLKFAHKIDIKGWNKNEVLLKTTVVTNKPELEKVHTMEVTDGANLLSVHTDYDHELLKKNHLNNTCWDCDEESRSKNGEKCFCLKVSYEIWLPYEADFSLESINGSVEIRDFRGPAKIKTINGFVDMDWNPAAGADLSFNSINGELYSDFDIKADKNNTSYSKRLESPVNGGGKKIRLETINGDVYFRKKK